MNKLLAIVGPTASGKSDLAVDIALRFNGEVISADSRQVYTDLDIGTGKITREEMKGIPHHLLDIVNPQARFSAGEYKKYADEVVYDIQSRNKLPILCGGTGFFVQAVVDDLVFPEVLPNERLRNELKNTSKEELLDTLKKLDPQRAESIDQHNPRRLIRAIEIAQALGSVPLLKRNERFDTLQIGLAVPDEILRERIYKRLIARIDQGMIEEAENLRDKGLTFERMRELGLEYKYLADLLEGLLNKEQFIERLFYASWYYARRQMTWFKKDTRIEWFDFKEKEEIEKRVKGWILK